MKKTLLTLSVAAIAAAGVSAQTADVRFVNFGKKHLSETAVMNRALTKENIRRATSKELWKAGTVTTYYIADDQWTEAEKTNYQYNVHGDVTKYTKATETCEYSYDALGRCTGFTTYDPTVEPPLPYSKQEYAYDTVVKDLIVSTTTYFYNQEKKEWDILNGEKDVITRNADGNVTKIESLEYESWTDVPGWNNKYLVEITYGADKKANAFKVTYIDGTLTEVEADVADITWYETNGQLVDFEMDEYDFFMGANRIKSARGLKEGTYPYVGDITYANEYKADNKGYKFTANLLGELYMSTDYTVLDQYGSYTSEEYEIDYDSEDDGSYVRDDAQLSVYSKVYDAYGLVLKNSETYYDGSDKTLPFNSQYLTTGKVTYDPVHGYPLEYIVSNAYDGDEPQLYSREVFSDYYDVIAAGVDTIEATDNAPVEYYNLQGVRVQNPESGLYIRRQGSKVTKVLVK